MRARIGTAYVTHLAWLQAIHARDPRASPGLGWIAARDLHGEHGLIHVPLDGAPVVRPDADSAASGDLLHLASQENGVIVVDAKVDADAPAPAPCSGRRL